MNEWVTIEKASSATGIEARIIKALVTHKFVPSKFESGSLLVDLQALNEFAKKANEFIKTLASIIASRKKIHDYDAIRIALKEVALRKGFKPFPQACVELGVRPEVLRRIVKSGKAKTLRFGWNSIFVKVDDELIKLISESVRTVPFEEMNQALEVLMSE